MRILLFLLLFFPAVLNAQINRSARELAMENVQGYLEKKLFKDLPYTSISFSDLRTQTEIKTGIAWTIDHKFEITEKKQDAHQNTIKIRKPYRFIFYLDDRMKVLWAESYLVY